MNIEIENVTTAADSGIPLEAIGALLLVLLINVAVVYYVLGLGIRQQAMYAGLLPLLMVYSIILVFVSWAINAYNES